MMNEQEIREKYELPFRELCKNWPGSIQRETVDAAYNRFVTMTDKGLDHKRMMRLVQTYGFDCLNNGIPGRKRLRLADWLETEDKKGRIYEPATVYGYHRTANGKTLTAWKRKDED